MAFAVWKIDNILRQTLTPKLRLMLDIIRADGYDGEYCPVDQMVDTRRAESEKPVSVVCGRNEYGPITLTSLPEGDEG